MGKKPNIVIFMTDHQRRETMPGYDWCITPALDAFARDAVTFTNAVCPSPHCCPSRATFFSGLYPSQHGVWNNVEVGNALSRGLSEGVKLWSEDLRENGYRLFFSGKWHVSSLEGPEDRGFTVLDHPRQAAKPRSGDVAQTALAGDWRMYAERPLSDPSAPRRRGEIQREGYPEYFLYGETEHPFRDEETVEAAVRHIRTSLTGDGEPWCLYVGTVGPHDPYLVPQRFLDLYGPGKVQLPANYRDSLQDRPGLYRRTQARYAQLSDGEHLEALRHYLALCSFEDSLFGQVCDALKDKGLYEDTVILYLSDHGDYAGAHGLWAKGLPCFREAYAIPLMIHLPGGVRGTRSDYPACLADIAPTLLDVCGIPLARRVQGVSLAGILRGTGEPPRRAYRFTQTNGNELYGIQRSVFNEDWKYVFNGFDLDELYDLKHDPGETCNLAGDPRYAPVIRELSRALWRFARESGDTIVNPYIMTALAPYGPGLVLEEGDGAAPGHPVP